MISGVVQERAKQRLLSLATEDWYSVAEGESAVRMLLPDAGIELRQVVATALLSLLHQGLIQIARLNLATGETDPISEAEVGIVLEDDGNWAPARTGDLRTVAFTATPLGEQWYFDTPGR